MVNNLFRPRCSFVVLAFLCVMVSSCVGGFNVSRSADIDREAGSGAAVGEEVCFPNYLEVWHPEWGCLPDSRVFYREKVEEAYLEVMGRKISWDSTGMGRDEADLQRSVVKYLEFSMVTCADADDSETVAESCVDGRVEELRDRLTGSEFLSQTDAVRGLLLRAESHAAELSAAMVAMSYFKAKKDEQRAVVREDAENVMASLIPMERLFEKYRGAWSDTDGSMISCKLRGARSDLDLVLSGECEGKVIVSESLAQDLNGKNGILPGCDFEMIKCLGVK